MKTETRFNKKKSFVFSLVKMSSKKLYNIWTTHNTFSNQILICIKTVAKLGLLMKYCLVNVYLPLGFFPVSSIPASSATEAGSQLGTCCLTTCIS